MAEKTKKFEAAQRGQIKEQLRAVELSEMLQIQSGKIQKVKDDVKNEIKELKYKNMCLKKECQRYIDMIVVGKK